MKRPAWAATKQPAANRRGYNVLLYDGPGQEHNLIIDTMRIYPDWENKILVHFTAAEGAGMHCEAMARSLYDQRKFDWLDATLGVSG